MTDHLSSYFVIMILSLRVRILQLKLIHKLSLSNLQYSIRSFINCRNEIFHYIIYCFIILLGDEWKNLLFPALQER
jgi:hypothetical protein